MTVFHPPLLNFTDEEMKPILEAMDAISGDLMLFVADKARVVYDSLGHLRTEIAKSWTYLIRMNSNWFGLRTFRYLNMMRKKTVM